MGEGGEEKVEDVNEKDGFVLFFILAFHIFLKKQTKTKTQQTKTQPTQ